MNGEARKWVTVIALGSMAVSLAVTYELADEGYCFSQRRFASDEELIRSAVRFLGPRMDLQPTDRTIDSFLARYPKCCEVDRQPKARLWLDLITGYNFSEVSVVYPDPRATSSTEPYYESYVAVEACGRAVRWQKGTSVAAWRAG